MEITTLPRSCSATASTVGAAPSHGVAITTMSASDAPALSAAWIVEVALGPSLA
jgi:hypothetical protein